MDEEQAPADPPDAAFTLTEMAASLVVAAMLISGLAEITRQYARTFVEVSSELAETRSARLAQARFEQLERADPDSIVVRPDQVAVELGGVPFSLRLTDDASGGRALEQVADEAAGSALAFALSLDETARFEQGVDQAIRLWSGEDRPPVVVVRPRREAPFDCRYDAVARRCR
ncbi:MAG: hypothetical protein PVI23_15070 [Maricaulaceae bacterium]|jgi:hypothetical protein